MIKIRGILASLVFLFAGTASAAPVAIDSLFVENATAVLTVGILGPYTATTGIAPPAEITMGSFQSSILTASTSGFGINIYSTDLYGATAPSGTVDGSTIFVDFSSLRASMSYAGSTYDVALWPLTTTLDAASSYNPLDSTYNLLWSDSFRIDVSSIFGSFSTPATLDVSLDGYLTTVPVPAAIWLFGMGLVSLFGFSQASRKQK